MTAAERFKVKNDIPPGGTLDRLNHISTRMWAEIDRACSVEAILEVGNSHEISAHFDGTPAARGMLIVRRTLTWDLVLCIMRIHDRRNGTSSLHSAQSLLRNPSVQAELIARRGRHFEAVEGLPLKQEIDEFVDRVNGLWKSAESGPRLERLKHSRDNYLAHAGLPEEDEPPTFDDMFSQLSQAGELVTRLANMLGTILVSIDAPRKVWTARANDYWNAVCRSSK